MSYWQNFIKEDMYEISSEVEYETQTKTVALHPLSLEIIIIVFGALLKVAIGILGRVAKYKDMDYAMLLDI